MILSCAIPPKLLAQRYHSGEVPRYEVGLQFDFNYLDGVGDWGGGFGGLALQLQRTFRTRFANHLSPARCVCSHGYCRRNRSYRANHGLVWTARWAAGSRHRVFPPRPGGLPAFWLGQRRLTPEPEHFSRIRCGRSFGTLYWADDFALRDGRTDCRLRGMRPSRPNRIKFRRHPRAWVRAPAPYLAWESAFVSDPSASTALCNASQRPITTVHSPD